MRHPAAFVASLKVKDWKFDYFNFANQPLLIKEKLQKFETQINYFVENPNQDIIKQGILLWNIIYDVVHEYEKNIPIGMLSLMKNFPLIHLWNMRKSLNISIWIFLIR